MQYAQVVSSSHRNAKPPAEFTAFILQRVTQSFAANKDGHIMCGRSAVLHKTRQAS